MSICTVCHAEMPPEDCIQENNFNCRPAVGNVRYSAPAHQSAIADAAARLPTLHPKI